MPSHALRVEWLISIALLGVITGVVTALTYAGLGRRRRQMRERLRAIEGGRRCVACNGEKVEFLGATQVHCLDCGATIELEELQGPVISDNEMAKLITPPAGGRAGPR